MYAPHLQIQLAALGFEDDARDLGEAATDAEARVAIQGALHAVEGYQLAFYRHSRALQHTSAAFEREQLAGLEEALRARLEAIDASGRAA